MANANGNNGEARPNQPRKLAPHQVVALLARFAPDLMDSAEVVGQWVWIRAIPQHARAPILRRIGFRFSDKRNAWCHPCGTFRRYNPRVNPWHAFSVVPARALEGAEE